jgi:hypothetical protein
MVGEVADLALDGIRAAVDDVPHQAVAGGALVGRGLLHGTQGVKWKGWKAVTNFSVRVSRASSEHTVHGSSPVGALTISAPPKPLISARGRSGRGSRCR